MVSSSEIILKTLKEKSSNDKTLCQFVTKIFNIEMESPKNFKKIYCNLIDELIDKWDEIDED